MIALRANLTQYVAILLQKGADPNVKYRVCACWLVALLDLIWCNMLLCVAG
jgi:hypothetical protein